MILGGLIVIFSILTFNGWVISFLLFKESNKLIKLGSSMILGLLGYLMLLSIFSYFLKGPIALKGIFLFYFFVCLFTYWKYIRKHNPLRRLFDFKYNYSNILTLLVLAFYVFFIFLFGSGYAIGGDGDMYWGIATSFTRGNYPTHLSWQPNYLTVYHQGTFLVEGAIRALFGTGIASIHNFFTAFVLSAIFIFVTGMAREITKSAYSVLPSIFTLILLGGPVVLKTSYIQFFTDIFSAEGPSVRTYIKNVIYDLSSYPTYGYFQGSNGGGVVSIKEMFYTNFYTFGLSAFILFAFLFGKEVKREFNLKNLSILTVFSFLILGIDETFFIVSFVLLLSLIIFKFRNLSFKKIIKYSFTLSFIGVTLFFVIQNPIRDSILTPSPELPRFKLLIETDIENKFISNITYRKDEYLNWNGVPQGITAHQLALSSIRYGADRVVEINGLVWQKLDYRLVFIITLFILLSVTAPNARILALSSFIAFVFSIVIVNTFWPPNKFRMVNQAAQLLILSQGFIFLKLDKLKNKFFRYLLIILLILIFLPQFLVSHAKFLIEAVYTQHSYFTTNSASFFLTELEALVPWPSRIIFIETYPYEAEAPYVTMSAFTRHGLPIPLSEPKPKVLNPAKGLQWYDAVSKLSPYALKELEVDYVFVYKTGLKHLSDNRVEQLNNPSYFALIKSWDEGSLYRVDNSFKNLDDDKEGTLKGLISKIGTGKKVYLGKFKLTEIRQIFLLNLSKQNHLLGPKHAHGGDFFMYIETIVPFEGICPAEGCEVSHIKDIDDIKYALMRPEEDPNLLLNGNFKKIASIQNVDLWENIKLKEIPNE